METFYKHMNNFIWQHPFIKGCIHFTSRFCPYMIIIFYSLFLLKIYNFHNFYYIKLHQKKQCKIFALLFLICKIFYYLPYIYIFICIYFMFILTNLFLTNFYIFLTAQTLNIGVGL